jgi:hypothetical protein
MAQESRPAETNCETAEDYQRAGIRSASSVSRPADIISAQLGRIETILDRILAGAR